VRCSGKMTEITCTEEVIDEIVSRMEAGVAKVEECQGSMVKLKRAEMEVLKAFEEARDYMNKMLQSETREKLVNIFGGDCTRIAMIGNCLKSVEFSDPGTRNDQRNAGCQDACDSVEKVLEDLGLGWALRQAQQAEADKRARRQTEIIPESIMEQLQPEIEVVDTGTVVIEEPERTPTPEPEPPKPEPEPPKPEANEESLIDRMLACTEVAELAELGEIDRKKDLGNWMIWMVHRAHLNDPTLVKLDFSNLQMPLPNEEPRVQPKLAKALATNSHMEQLLLPNTNLQSREAGVIAESLTQNSALTELNVDSNFIASAEMESLANSVGVNQTLQILRVNNQRGLKLGNAHYEAFVKALEANEKLVKLGMTVENAAFSDKINRLQMRNNDKARKARNAAKAAAGYA